jgi:hypothetical protein
MSVDDPYTTLLLHFEGLDTSTTFTDESGKVWTASGSAQIDTAEYKWGGSSGLFLAATSDSITAADDAIWTLGSDDWTLEMWGKLSTTDASANRFLFTVGGTGSSSDNAIFFRLATSTLLPGVFCGLHQGQPLPLRPVMPSMI